jgi:hypothetical protein
VEKAVKLWSAAEDRRHLALTPEAVGNAMLALRLRPDDKPASPTGGLTDRIFMSGVDASGSGRLGVDLVAAGIHAIGHLFNT